MRRLLVLLFVPLLLTVVSCGGDSDSDGEGSKQNSDSNNQQAKDEKPKVKPATDGPELDGVKVTGGGEAKPKVSFDKKPFKVGKTVAKVLKEGNGEPLKAGEQAEVQYLGINGRDGKEFDSSWKRDREPLSFQVDPQQMIKGFVRGLVGKKVGSRVLVAIPPAEGYGKQGNPQAKIKGTDSLVFVVDLTSSTGQEKKELAKVKASSADDVTVEGKLGSKPKVSFDQPFKADKVDTNVENPGGKKVAAGERAIVDYVGVLGRNGEEFDASGWKPTANPVAFEMTKDKLLSGFYKSLVGQRVGSRVTITVPPKDGFGKQGNQQLGVRGTDTVVFVVDIKAALKPEKKASGSKVTPPKSLPTVSASKDYPDKMTVPKGAEAPSELTVQPLIKGKGAKVTEDDTVATVHYSAFNWRDGSMFDFSWQGRQDPMTGQSSEPEPLDVPLAGYESIPGLPKALVDQTVGSRVMVVLPPDEGFKSRGGLKSAKVKPTDTTVFVVDILGAA